MWQRRQAVGLGFVAVLALLAGLLVQDYRRALPWQHRTTATLIVPAAGLNLDPPADVKIRGVIVGEVTSVSADGTAARIHFTLFGSQRAVIPANVDATVIPKTLFGEKYVNLIPPARPSAVPLAADAVITQSPHAVEIEQVFADLEPVLQTLHPQLVSRTLTALASALDGRGAQLGATISELNTYLGAIDPHLPTLIHDVALLAKTSQLYAANASNLLRAADDARVISNQLLVPDHAALDNLLTQVGTLAKTATRTVRTDGDALISLSGQMLPVLSLLSQYSSVLPCLVHGFVVGNSLTDHALGGAGPWLRVTLDLPSSQNGVYTAPKDLQSNPSADANLNNLDKNVRSYAPYCTQVQNYADGLADVGPLSYNYHGGHGTSAGQVRTAIGDQPRTTGIGAAGSRSEVAFAGTLSHKANPGLTDLFLGPLLHSGAVLG